MKEIMTSSVLLNKVDGLVCVISICKNPFNLHILTPKTNLSSKLYMYLFCQSLHRHASTNDFYIFVIFKINMHSDSTIDN